MSPSEVVRIGQEALLMVLLLSAPVLLVAVVVGTVVSLVQAVTQVHEQTLAFLPKLLGVALVLAVAGGWLVEQAVGYAARSFERSAAVGS